MDEEFTTDQIKAAVAKATEAWATGKNYSTKSLTQFASECAKAMDPRAREHVDDVFTNAYDAWKRDGESEDKPLQKRFKKPYALAMGMLGGLAPARAKAEPLPEAIATDAFAYAHHTADVQRVDASKAAKVVEKAVADLANVYETFPAQRLNDALRELQRVTASVLEGAYEQTVYEREQEVKRAEAKGRSAKPAKAAVATQAAITARTIAATILQPKGPNADEIGEAADDLLN